MGVTMNKQEINTKLNIIQEGVNANAAAYAAGKTANTVTKPFRWAAGKVGSFAARQAKKGAAAARDAIANAVKKRYKRFKNRNKVRPAKQPGMAKALYKGLKGD